MRKLLSLVTLCCVMAIAAGVSVSDANAATLTNAVHSLKAEQTSVVEKAYYHHHHYYYHHYHPYYRHHHRPYYYHHRHHCWWHHGHRRCRWY
jgi:hypothetical protein